MHELDVSYAVLAATSEGLHVVEGRCFSCQFPTGERTTESLLLEQSSDATFCNACFIHLLHLIRILVFTTFANAHFSQGDILARRAFA